MILVNKTQHKNNCKALGFKKIPRLLKLLQQTVHLSRCTTFFLSSFGGKLWEGANLQRKQISGAVRHQENGSGL